MQHRTGSVPGRHDLIVVASVVIIWGLSWPVMKSSVAIVPPIWFTVLRYLVGALALILVLAPTRGLRLPNRRDWPVVLSVGVLQMLAYTMPLWVLPIAALLVGTRFGMRQVLATALGLCGILALMDFSGFLVSGTDTLMACVLLLAAALAWAICMVHVHHHRWVGATVDLAPWQMALATVCLLPLAFAMEGAPHLSWVLDTWDNLLFLGVLATAFCSWAVVDVGTRSGAGVVSIALLGVPVVGLAASLIVGQESPSLSLLAGTAAILCSISVVIPRGARA